MSLGKYFCWSTQPFLSNIATGIETMQVFLTTKSQTNIFSCFSRFCQRRSSILFATRSSNVAEYWGSTYFIFHYSNPIFFLITFHILDLYIYSVVILKMLLKMNDFLPCRTLSQIQKRKLCSSWSTVLPDLAATTMVNTTTTATMV